MCGDKDKKDQEEEPGTLSREGEALCLDECDQEDKAKSGSEGERIDEITPDTI